jgi:hypothetical protein
MAFPIIPPFISVASVSPNSIVININNYGQNPVTLGANLRLFKANNPSVFSTPVFAIVNKPQTRFEFNNLTPNTTYFFGAMNNIGQISNTIAAQTAPPPPTPTPTITPTIAPTKTPTPTPTKTPASTRAPLSGFNSTITVIPPTVIPALSGDQNYISLFACTSSSGWVNGNSASTVYFYALTSTNIPLSSVAPSVSANVVAITNPNRNERCVVIPSIKINTTYYIYATNNFGQRTEPITFISNKPNWVPASGQQYSAALFAASNLSGIAINAYGSEFAIFDGSRIAGASPLSDAPSGRKVFQVPVYANVPSASGYSIKVYDAFTNRIYNLTQTFNFVANTFTGSITSPVTYNIGTPDSTPTPTPTKTRTPSLTGSPEPTRTVTPTPSITPSKTRSS